MSARTMSSQQEKNILIRLYGTGQMKDAALAAQALTIRHPLDGFGWKVLGAALQELGRNNESLAPKRSAVKLAPDDPHAHSNLSSTLRELGKLDEARLSSQRALVLNPEHAEAHNNLGYILRELGQSEDALVVYRRSLRIRPDYADAHNNLGVALRDIGQLINAERSFRSALQIRPDHVETLNNMGNVLRDLGRLTDAKSTYCRALVVRPKFADLLLSLGITLCYATDFEEASKVYREAVVVDPGRSGLKAGTYLAVLQYVEGNFENCKTTLANARLILEKQAPEFRNARRYWRYLNALLDLRQQKPASNIEATTRPTTLHVIGDSHSLSAHSALIRYRGQSFHCTAKWIAGCKQWHLGNDRNNQYKYAFESILAHTPSRSTFLLSIGEIDCRSDEGIIKAWKKFPAKSLKDLANATVDSYLSYVIKSANAKGHRLIVCGVPCNNRNMGSSDKDSAELVSGLIRTVNIRLMQQALAAGLDFLDLHTLTDDGGGVTKGIWHIDDVHLLPNAFVTAFDHHLRLGRPIHG